MAKPFVRDAYNYDRNAVSKATALCCRDKTLAKQSFQRECDINYIAERFGLTGQWPENVRVPRYGDFTGIKSFQEALNAVASAHESFDAMPAEVRSRFQNDPVLFVDFCSDPANIPEMVKMGLAVTVPPEAPVPPAPSVGAPVAPPAGA